MAGLTRRFAISSLLFLATGVAAILIIPQFDPGRNGGTQPGFTTFFGVGLVLILLTGGLVYFGLRSHFGAMPLVMINIVAFNSLIVLVKFVFAPASLYAANLSRELTVFVNIPAAWTAAIGIGVLVLYATAFWLLHGLISARYVSGKARWLGWLLPILIFGLLTVSGFWILFFIGLGDYLFFVFSTPAAIFIGLALAGAVGLASATIVGIGRQTELVRDTTLLAAFLWIGLAFLALYHVLWFVYMMVLLSIWPLRTVVPK